jgi:hypothetical protein
LNSASDDGIVVIPAGPRRTDERADTIGNHNDSRRFFAIMRTRKTADPRHKSGDILTAIREFDRRQSIIDEEHLRRLIARDGALQRDDPAEWEKREKSRLARNRETAAINRRLRAEKLRPIELEPSFEQRVKKLQQLEARNRAGTATRETR